MATQGDKIAPIDAKIEAFTNLPVIKDYYHFMDGEKIGTDFLRHARKNRFPFMLVIDRDKNAPASREAQILKIRSELEALLRKKAKTPPQKETKGNHSGKEKEEEKEEEEEEEERSIRENGETEAYFYAMDMHSVPSLFSFGIPEYHPCHAMPCHAVAYILTDILKFPIQEARTEESHKANLSEIDSSEKIGQEKTDLSDLSDM